MNNEMGPVRCIHLVGIAGSGMAGIAEVLINLGYQVQGSDRRLGSATERLASLGAEIYEGHADTNLGAADAVVVSSAVAESNPEIVEAHRRRIPVVQRAEMLAEIMRFRYGIAVAGTHGKTTTTSLIASILAEAGLDPTFIIGGRLTSANANAKLGAGKYLVAEADESDASFLHLQPMIAVVTNIDADHLLSYEGQLSRLCQAFEDFLHNLPFYGLGVMCLDDKTTRELIPNLGRRVISYGLSDHADVCADRVKQVGLQTHFKVHRKGRVPLDIRLNLPGLHNVRNALAAIAVSTELEVDELSMQQALAEFSGIDRRFQVLGTITTPVGRVTFVDDYAHHPTEIDATLCAARKAWPERRLVVAFEPHRYSRTQELMDDFASVLSSADVLVLTDVYGAGEKPIAGADGRALVRTIRARRVVDPIFVGQADRLSSVLADLIQGDDVVLTLGAGSIGAVAQSLPSELAVKVPVGLKR